MARGDEPVVLTLLDVDYEAAGREMYFLPLAFSAGQHGDDVLRTSPELVVARISGARTGVLHERLDLDVVHRLLEYIGREKDFAGRAGRFVATVTSA